MNVCLGACTVGMLVAFIVISARTPNPCVCNEALVVAVLHNASAGACRDERAALVMSVAYRDSRPSTCERAERVTLRVRVEHASAFEVESALGVDDVECSSASVNERVCTFDAVASSSRQLATMTALFPAGDSFETRVYAQTCESGTYRALTPPIALDLCTLAPTPAPTADPDCPYECPYLEDSESVVEACTNAGTCQAFSCDVAGDVLCPCSAGAGVPCDCGGSCACLVRENDTTLVQRACV